MTAPLKIAIAGLGTVGGGVVKALAARRRRAVRRAPAARLRSWRVSARDAEQGARLHSREFRPPIRWPWPRSDADVVVELIGGDEGVARELVEAALANGKHVVTANKALLAKHGTALGRAGREEGSALKFEAAVAGGIPIVKTLRESLIAYGVQAVKGILNGTCNYILTEMEATGRAFADVLKEAQALGYAEADPTLGCRRRRHRAQAGACSPAWPSARRPICPR